MKYDDGQEVLLGDKVRHGKTNGIVVFIIDTNQYSPDFPAEDWKYLERGVMINFESIGMVHHEHGPDEDIVLVARG